MAVLSLAYDTAKESAGDHLRTAFDDGREIVRETPVKAPLRLAFNNMKLGYSLVEDMIDITREVLEDLERVGREHQQRRAQFGKPGS